MASTSPVTPQRIRAARLLKQLNDADALPTGRDVLDLAALDPDEPVIAPVDVPRAAPGAPVPVVGSAPWATLEDLPEGVLARALQAKRARSQRA